MDFNRIVLSWKGDPYIIEKGAVLDAIARVEDVLTISDLAEAQQRGKFPAAKLSKAYGAALRFAGADVTDKEIYFGMFGNGEGGDVVMTAVSGLLAMMVPVGIVEAPASGNAQADEAADRNASSANASQPSSAPAASRRKRSGK